MTLFGLLALTGAGAVAFSGSRVEYGEARQSVALIEQARELSVTQNTDLDSDKDDLRDWEEQLWGTDAQNPDTDGDEVTDGDESDNGHNPAVAGPDDVFTLEGLSESAEESESPTQTDRLAADFFKKYLSYRQSGAISDTAVQEELVGEVLAAIQAPANAPVFEKKDILVGAERSDEAARGYGNVVGAILARNSIDNENEAVILLRALTEESEDELKKLEPIEAAYRGMARELKQVVVPADASALHINLLNAVSGMERIIADMRQAFIDPLVTAQAISQYQARATALFNALVGLAIYLEETHNLEFESVESGSFITEPTELP